MRLKLFYRNKIVMKHITKSINNGDILLKCERCGESGRVYAGATKQTREYSIKDFECQHKHESKSK